MPKMTVEQALPARWVEVTGPMLGADASIQELADRTEEIYVWSAKPSDPARRTLALHYDAVTDLNYVFVRDTKQNVLQAWMVLYGQR
jgi:hypothetical protein